MNKEIAHTELLAQYTNRGNNQKETFSMTYVLSSPIHPYVITGGQAHLFINIRDSKNNLVAKHTWLNHNASMVKLELTPGDRIQGQWWCEQYWYGNNYHQNNVRRASNKAIYRFLFPQNVVKASIEPIPEQRILNLKDLSIHNDFDTIFGANVTAEVYWLSFIQLTDNCHLWNLQKVNKQYPPEYVLLSKWKQLTEEQRTKVLDCRKYTYTQILEYQKLMKNI